jgi:L,D-peptidoglycan transpeptidase YkuD (ErfK/YbiS/YcfS/YnhG family)
MQKNWLVLSINKKYFLRVGKKTLQCQIGSKGLRNAVKKVEGDKTTPIGKWYFKSLYYRSDRVLRPKFKKIFFSKINRITKNSGWCDDVNSLHYNKFINIKNILKKNVSFERLWRQDNAYDIIIELSHNTKPIIKNKGSAIFIHCSFEDFKPTSGCIALKKRDLIFLFKNLKRDTYIQIKN